MEYYIRRIKNSWNKFLIFQKKKKEKERIKILYISNIFEDY